MANIFLNLPVGNPGASIDTSAMGADKSIVVGGSLGGGAVTIEISNDGGATFQPICSFTAPGKKIIPVAAQFMRANGSASANVDVGANDNGALFAILPLPAGNGPGAPVNVAALGNFTTFVVGGSFPGASVAVEVSEDGVSYSTCAMFAGQGGEQSKIVVGNFMRTFVRGRSPLPFTATASVGAEIDAEPGDGRSYAPPEKWGRDNIGAASPAAPMSCMVSTKFDDIEAIRDGSVIGLNARLTEALAAGGITARVTINGIPGALVVVGGKGFISGRSTQGSGIDTFSAGDRLGIILSTEPGTAPITADAEAWIDLEL